MSEEAIHTKLTTKSCEPDRSPNRIRRINTRRRTVNTKEIRSVNNDRKKYLITRCPDFKPTSFRFVYNDKWLVEDDSHFIRTLQKYNINIPDDKIRDKKSLTEAMLALKARVTDKKKAIRQTPTPDEDFTIDEEDAEIPTTNQPIESFIKSFVQIPEQVPGRPIDRILYEDKDLHANQVKVISRKPFKLAYTDGRFCQHEIISARKLLKLRQRGIDVNLLAKQNPDEYYDQFTRCYAAGIRQLNGKYYCENHYRHMKYGRNLSEDFNDLA